MKKLIHFITPAFLLLNPFISYATDVNPADLIKVNANNHSKCVEYYSHNEDLYCSTTALQSEAMDPSLLKYEKLKITFDDRYWLAAWGKHDSTITTIEYIPNGENINHWNELITSQFFPDAKATPKQFVEIFLQKAKEAGYNPIVTFLEETKDRVIFEFRIEQPQDQIQDELQMVTKDNQGLYVLHYAIKKANMDQKNREKWVQNLKNSSIK